MHKLKKIILLLFISTLFLFVSCKNINITLPQINTNPDILEPSIPNPDIKPNNNDSTSKPNEKPGTPLIPLVPSKPVENPSTPLIPLEPSKPVEKPQCEKKGDVVVNGNRATNIKLNISVELDRVYNQKEDVALYLVAFKKLPRNYYNREDFKRLKGTWTKENLISCTGGRFNNREGLLPNTSTYIECDIDYRGTPSRNAYRIVFSTKYDYIYYTHDHYSSFVRLYNGYIYDGVTEYV